MLFAALLGSLAPDASLYIMGGVSLFILGIPPQVVFDELYFSDAWQTVFAIDNSFIVWGALFAAATAWRKPWAVAFTGAALLHLALDFPLHHDDGRPHFWPVTDWVFESPFSYWDRAQGAMWIAPMELGATLMAAAVLMWRGLPVWAFLAIAALVCAEAWIVYQWMFVFAA